MKVPQIMTRNLRLRPFTRADVEDFYAILQGKDMLKYFPGSGKITYQGAEKWVGLMINHWQQHGYGLWALDSRENEQFIGRCGLQLIEETNEVEVDFIIRRDDWGRGLATEAGLEALKYGFETLNLDTIVGIVHQGNAASQSVLQKIGMQNSGAAEYFGIAVYKYVIDSRTYWGRERALNEPNS